ncbi:SUMO-activating enzyme subunit 1 [Acropora cervicornis]|uniref:SUMO-activating enzyme subunit 1 n=1 Tax=Acropora cervicornis TaxID=6130 RepID=A0AAD9QFI8_ACRCE|nr:SUMO-activating enzyme subunit 1 [Acropora cervicornis]
MITLAKKIKEEKEKKEKGQGAADSAKTSRVSVRDKLLAKEITELEANLPESCKVEFHDPNVLHKFTLTIAPGEGYWKEGIFIFLIMIPEEYNIKPPHVCCETKIWHPNISENGEVCLSKRAGEVLHEVLTKLREVFAAYLNVREHFVLERGNFCKYPSMSDERNGNAITEDEAALYDRQIRLWGLDAQKRLRASRVLLVGIKGIGAEICKNLVLSGVKSITLMDFGQVDEEDFVAQFLVQREDLGKNRAKSSLQRAQQLNPMVQVTADCGYISDKADSFFKSFDLVVATNCSTDQLIHINEVCHSKGVKFFAADVFGFYGFIEKPKIIKTADNKNASSDGEPEAKRRKVHITETVVVQKTLKRLPSVYFIVKVILEFQRQYDRRPQTVTNPEDIENLIKLRDEVLKELNLNQTLLADEFASHCTAQVSPVCAIVGGIVGQEVVKAVSGKDAPLNNFFFYDGLEGHGSVECFH